MTAATAPTTTWFQACRLIIALESRSLVRTRGSLRLFVLLPAIGLLLLLYAPDFVTRGHDMSGTSIPGTVALSPEIPDDISSTIRANADEAVVAVDAREAVRDREATIGITRETRGGRDVAVIYFTELDESGSVAAASAVRALERARLNALTASVASAPVSVPDLEFKELGQSSTANRIRLAGLLPLALVICAGSVIGTAANFLGVSTRSRLESELLMPMNRQQFSAGKLLAAAACSTVMLPVVLVVLGVGSALVGERNPVAALDVRAAAWATFALVNLLAAAAAVGLFVGALARSAEARILAPVSLLPFWFVGYAYSSGINPVAPWIADLFPVFGPLDAMWHGVLGHTSALRTVAAVVSTVGLCVASVVASARLLDRT